MKNIIAAVEMNRKNGKQLTMKNLLDTTRMDEDAKMLSVFDLGNKYSQPINIADIIVARNRELTDIRKY